jgi:exo-1,4-beta-D-glucosaminidase
VSAHNLDILVVPQTLATQDLTFFSNTRYYTPVSEYADYTWLDRAQPANVSVSATKDNDKKVAVALENHSSYPAVFIRLNLVRQSKTVTPKHSRWEHVTPVKWSDNYVTLWPHEKMVLQVDVMQTAQNPDTLLVSSKNTHDIEVPIM